MKWACWGPELCCMHEFAHHHLFPIHSSAGVSWAWRDLLWGGESRALEQSISLKHTACEGWFCCYKPRHGHTPPFSMKRSVTVRQIEALAPSISYSQCRPSVGRAFCPVWSYRPATGGHNLRLLQSTEASNLTWLSLVLWEVTVAIVAYCEPSLGVFQEWHVW